MTSEVFSLKLNDFEGPLDLLLQLIEKRKLHISKVSIAAVTDDYVAYLASFNQLPKHEAADFLVIASTLMLIKSSSLLPAMTLSAEEETDTAELERRLKLYQYIQTISGNIRKKYGAQSLYFREPNKNITPVFAPTTEISAPNLLEAIRRVLATVPKPEVLPQVIVRKIRSLQETIDDLAERIGRAVSLKFSDFAPRLPAGRQAIREEKVSVIVSFLGMLELVKQGIIDVEQGGHFQDISMQTTSPGIPRY
jgi:segregation and condensation protein A